jgi:hypothetical protein
MWGADFACAGGPPLGAAPTDGALPVAPYWWQITGGPYRRFRDDDQWSGHVYHEDKVHWTLCRAKRD